MNKKLVAVAIAGLLAAPLAHAQTANVTLYGGLRVNVEYAKYTGPNNSEGVWSIDSISSRWGLRGSEALGRGMNAIFQCETGVAVDSGANPAAGAAGMCGREGWVGLNGTWGEFKLGYGLTPYDDVKGLTDHQGSNSWENPNNGVSSGPGFAKQGLFSNYGTGQVGTNSGAFDARYSNSISYKSPRWAGFDFRTQYAILDETFAKQAWGWDTAGIYRNGPFTGGLTYAYHSDFAGLGGTATGLNDQQAWRLAAVWDAGVWQIDGYYDQAKYKFAGNQIPSNVAIPLTYKYKNWSIGGLYRWQAWVFGAQYNSRDNGLATAFDGGTSTTGGYNPGYANLNAWDSGGGDHYALTADYNLSKRTTLRMYYSYMKNENTLTNVSFPLNPFGDLSGSSKVSSFAAGLWHAF